jgi:hypothetical protein
LYGFQVKLCASHPPADQGLSSQHGCQSLCASPKSDSRQQQGHDNPQSQQLQLAQPPESPIMAEAGITLGS